MDRADETSVPASPDAALRVRALGERRRIERTRRRLRRVERRILGLRRRVRAAGPTKRFRRTEAKRARSARSRAERSLTMWQDLLLSVGSREGLRLMLDAGLVGRSTPRSAAPPEDARVLVLATRPGDHGIGAGGTLDQAERRGCAVRVELLADPTAERVAALLEEADPAHVFVPSVFEDAEADRRLTDAFVRAARSRPLGRHTQVWGYQVTTRVPGSTVVDITAVAARKRRRNEAAGRADAPIAAARDRAAALYLTKAGVPLLRGTGAGEVFVRYRAAEYVELVEQILALPARIEDAPAAPLAPAAPAGDVPPPDFLVVGMQKCGTYWLTALLDAHPDIRCFPSRPGRADGTGEAHLFDQLALMSTDYPQARRSLAGKLDGTFADLLADTAPADAFARGVLARALAERFSRYCDEQRRIHHARLVGEKTTETVHHPDLVERLFPQIKKIAILRDPRDRVVSFHFHEHRKNRRTDDRIDRSFVAAYAERITRDLEGLLALTAPVHVLTYEHLHTDPARTLAALLGFLDAPADPDTITSLLDHATFERLAGRPAGDRDPDSHFRSGTTGTWTDHLTPDDAAWLTDHLDHLHARVEQTYDLDLSAYRTAQAASSSA